ncbi:MAG: glycine cleavage system aminomethyltransferase GcvT [Myxococcota bacterium]
MKSLVLEGRHRDAGARFAEFAGFQMPMRYTTIKQEHHAVRTAAGLFDVSHMGEIRIEGEGATELVNSLVTHDLRSTDVGQARYTVLCNPDGGIVDDLLVYKLSDTNYLLCVNASGRDKDFAFLRQHAATPDLIRQESDDWGQLALQGPHAEAILAPLVADTLDLATLASFRFVTDVPIAGVPCLVSRTGYTGEDGFEIYMPSEGALAVFDRLMESGQEHGLVLCGLGCRDTLRLEARLPLYGQDLTPETNPLEAGLSWVVKLDKPESFVGQKAIEAVKASGVSRRLRGFRLEGRGIPRPHCPIYQGEQQVGELTSGTWSPTLEVGIGLGYVEVEHANAERLEIGIRNRRVAATVTRKPFYRRDDA